ncbi:DUF547 domain-containing protein [Maribacter litopenaei]|uniref:DUF547 domain-containing protein n=1 Tax=Maribacter litopenaei TaxID=2976127 RepID=A0ABY5Y416_9FLAO|nr:DUF547 domain-containing protein [Maribacter litopenaei]UWX53742.1 DUF547 domain-containing protein [Maribacter litopenaei]
MKHMNIVRILPIIFFIGCLTIKAQTQEENIDFNELSMEFLVKIKNNESTEGVQKTLSKVSIEALEKALDNNDKKLAFWVNIYNAYIQVILQKNPDLYKDRNDFFKADQIAIAGEDISFEKIEHGIIRGSQWEYGLGFIGKLFPGEFEKRLRVEEPITEYILPSIVVQKTVHLWLFMIGKDWMSNSPRVHPTI